jgi:Domain of unknown function (DUF4062)
MDQKPSHGSHVMVDGDNDLGNETTASTGADSAVRYAPRQQQPGVILTPDQRVRVFISSTLEELAAERAAARRAIRRLHLVPVWYESGARPHPPRRMYGAYLAQSQIFWVGIYCQRYGWVAPGWTSRRWPWSWAGRGVPRPVKTWGLSGQHSLSVPPGGTASQRCSRSRTPRMAMLLVWAAGGTTTKARLRHDLEARTPPIPRRRSCRAARVLHMVTTPASPAAHSGAV